MFFGGQVFRRAAKACQALLAALTGATCLGLMFTAPASSAAWNDVGWVAETIPAGDATGLLLYGDKTMKDMAGLPMSTYTSTTHYLAHYRSSNRWYTGVVVTNPGSSTATVTIDAYNPAGTITATKTVSIPAKGKISQLASDPTFLNISDGEGWIKVTSDNTVTAFVLYGDKISGGIGALPSSTLFSSVHIPHFSCKSPWYTGVSALNPNAYAISVTISAYYSGGTKIADYTTQVPANGKFSGMLNTLIPGANNTTGSVTVSAVKISDGTAASVGAMAVYGDTSKSPQQIAAVNATPSLGATELTFSDVKYQNSVVLGSWQTSIYLLNPSTSSYDVTFKIRKTDGTLAGSLTETLSAHEKWGGTITSLFGLTSTTKGFAYAYITSGVGSLAGMQLISASDPINQAYGLAAIEAQYKASSMLVPHYDVRSRWWSILAMANPDWNNTGVAAIPAMNAYANDGSAAGSNTSTVISSKQSMEDNVKDFFVP